MRQGRAALAQVEQYEFLPGVQDLLQRLAEAGVRPVRLCSRACDARGPPSRWVIILSVDNRRSNAARVCTDSGPRTLLNLLLWRCGAGYEMHAVTNYPEWYELIETKLRLSTHMPWTFVSCTGPMQARRPLRRSF